jgi:hypothetical protein
LNDFYFHRTSPLSPIAPRDQPCSAFISDSQTEGKDEVSGVRCSIINNRHGNNVDLPPALFRRAVFSRHQGQQGVGTSSSSLGINICTFVGYSTLSVRKIASIFNGKSAQTYQEACFTVSLHCQPRQQVDDKWILLKYGNACPRKIDLGSTYGFGLWQRLCWPMWTW